MSIERIDASKLRYVQEIAKITWPVAFGEILSKEQLDYMMEMMYNPQTLQQQLERGHEFYLYHVDGRVAGFMGLEPNYKGKKQLKIHKLYILPEFQGKGIGEAFIRLAEVRCVKLNLDSLTLNVNRYNKALHFYEKLNFTNVKSEDIEIGNGYLMEDFVMEKII